MDAASAVGMAPELPPEAELRRAARGRLRGRFVDFHTGEPVAGAIYHARHEKGVSRADANGEFDAVFGGGTLDFEAGAEGYCVVRGEITATLVDARGGLLIPLVAASPIRGVVMGADGATIARPYVFTIEPQAAAVTNPVPEGYPDGWRLHPEGLGGLIGDDLGGFELAGLVPRSTGYELHVSHVGYEKAVVPIATRPPGVPTVVDVLLRRAQGARIGALTGRTYLNERPNLATLWCGDEDDWERTRSRDELGTYRFERLPAGPGRLVATPADWILVDAELGPGVASWIGGNEVDVVIDEGAEVVQDVRMSVRMGTISGQITRSGPAAQEDTTEQAVLATSELVWIWSSTDSGGRYSIDVPVTGHDYRIHAGREIVSPVSAPVEPGAKGVDLVIEASPSFTLTARDADSGSELSTFLVQVRRTGAGEDWFPCPGPTYRAPLGPLDVRVFSPRHEPVVVQVQMGSVRENHFTVELKRR